MNLTRHPTTPKVLAITALVLAAPLAPAFDGDKFETLLTLGISRGAVIAVLGTPNRDNCGTTIGVRSCHLEWTSGGLLSAPVVYRATFIGDRLVAKSTRQGTPCATKE